MFLHLGADTVIPLKEVISITDIKLLKPGINEEFLKARKKENLVTDVSDGNAKSLIVTDKIVYLSAISSSTLKKRALFLNDSEEI